MTGPSPDKPGKGKTSPKIGRRGFLAAVAGAAPALSLSTSANAQESSHARSVPANPSLGPERDTPEVYSRHLGRTGSEVMVDLLRALDIDYVPSLPGSSFRGLQEAIVNYGGNKKPEFLTCLHEEAAVAMAHGYAKVARKPMAALIHGAVGLQHASMAIYNAYADNAPVIVLLGSTEEGHSRRPGVEWYHSAVDPAAMVRDYVKWDERPVSLQTFTENLVQAYDVATTAPMAPTLVVTDAEVQEAPLSKEDEARLRIPKLKQRSHPQGDSNAVRDAARLLANADNPVIIADNYARTDQGMPLLVTLAETLGAAVLDLRGRMNFPNTHPLHHSDRYGAVLREADVVLALEPVDLFGMLNTMPDVIGGSMVSRLKRGTKVISLGAGPLLIKGNYREAQRYSETDLSILGDGEATLPLLIAEIRLAQGGNVRVRAATRAQKLEQAHASSRERMRAEAAYAWDASPISTSRMCMELWHRVKGEDWCLASESRYQNDWPFKLWTFDKPYRHTGRPGAGGIGYTAPASLGVALANKERGRITISMNGDGDFLMCPGALWTAAHHELPLLMLIHNNRGYHQELMHMQRMAAWKKRPVERAVIGTTMTDPDIDYAKIAQGFGVYAEKPVSDPQELGPALDRALAIVKQGKPALIDVVSQPR